MDLQKAQTNPSIPYVREDKSLQNSEVTINGAHGSDFCKWYSLTTNFTRRNHGCMFGCNVIEASKELVHIPRMLGCLQPTSTHLILYM